MEYEDMIVTKDDAVVTIAVNRPKVLNAIRDVTMFEIGRISL